MANQLAPLELDLGRERGQGFLELGLQLRRFGDQPVGRDNGGGNVRVRRHTQPCAGAARHTDRRVQAALVALVLLALPVRGKSGATSSPA